MYKVIYNSEYADDGSVKVLCDADTMRVAGSSGDMARDQFMIIRVEEEGSKLGRMHG